MNQAVLDSNKIILKYYRIKDALTVEKSNCNRAVVQKCATLAGGGRKRVNQRNDDKKRLSKGTGHVLPSSSRVYHHRPVRE